LGGWATSSARELYYPLVNIDEHYTRLGDAKDWIDAVLATVEPHAVPPPLRMPDSPGQLNRWRHTSEQWRNALRIQTMESLGPICPQTATQILVQCAPMALVEGCALQYVSAAVTSHTETASALLRSYVLSAGAGGPARRFGSAYADLLNVVSVPLANRAYWALAREGAIADTMFAMPVFQLALSLFPRVRLPELLGVILFNAVVGLHPLLEAIAPSLSGWFEPTRHPLFADAAIRQKETMDMAMSAVAAQFADAGANGAGGGNDAWLRLGGGFAAAFSLLQTELTTLHALVNKGAFDAQARMIDLVRRKATFGAGYHGRCPLAGRSIDEWFKEDRFNAAAFVEALACSPFVRPGDPEHSALLLAAVSARGPMAGIFRGDELGVIGDWIRGLLQLGDVPVPMVTDPHTTSPPPVPTAPPAESAARINRTAKAYAQMPTRELYYHLLQVERYPDVLGFAKGYAALWLARAARSLEKGARPIPFLHYDHAALDAWLVKEHDRQIASYGGPHARPMPSREEVIESSVQLCPTVLIDGAWLQRFGNVALCQTAVGARLFRIYLDEVGNGCTRENHPNIYRELMSDMGVEIPVFGSIEFCQWPGFKDSAFLVPTFWLCISQYPRHFLPELLGLNLAMELSGVGGAYRSASDALRHYGYSSTFVDLHNTVDNISTGHTAIALDAIKIHLDEMLERGGLDDVQRHWRRVWTGYLALVPSAGYG
jgi:hypothetical protein